MATERSSNPHGRQWAGTLRLAWRDFVHEWRASLCAVFALAAVLAPLLVLFGLKSGIVTTMTERLKADPATRAVDIRGHHGFGPQWFEAMRARDDVGFVLPRTRLLAATITLIGGDRRAADVDMIPTGPGDPVLPAGLAAPADLPHIVLTHTLAARLQAGAGTKVEGIVSRRLDGAAEAVRIPLTVAGVLPEAAFAGEAAFVPLSLLIATEDYRDGDAVPALGADSGAPQHAQASERTFASARLYARGIDDVAPLAAHLRAQGLSVATRAAQIESVRAIDRVLSLIFAVLAGIAATGYLISLTASVWANVDRKRREIALLRLLGLRTAPLIGFPAAQALMVAAGGIAVSAVLYAIVAATFNAAFATHLAGEEYVCRLRPADGAIAAALTLVFALGASALGGYRATRIDPASSLREA
jgi:putative ABC transport system permease protein